MKLDHLIAPINLGALPPDQFLLAQACARRAKNLALMMARLDQRVKVIELHPDVLSADFAVLHLRRSYDLKKLLQSDNLAFIEEFRLLQIYIKRDLCFFPGDVRMRFASNGAILK